MDRFDEIKTLWQTQEIGDLPGISEVKISIGKFRNKKKRHFYFTIGALVAAFLLMLWVMYSYHSKLWTTRVGEIIMLATVLYVIYLKFKTNNKTEHDELLDNNAYLSKLKNDKVESCTGSSNQQLTAFSMLCVAYFFYLYETFSTNAGSLIIGYMLMLAVLALMWFVYRPLMVKRKRNSIKKFVNKIETIKNQNI